MEGSPLISTKTEDGWLLTTGKTVSCYKNYKEMMDAAYREKWKTDHHGISEQRDMPSDNGGSS